MAKNQSKNPYAEMTPKELEAAIRELKEEQFTLRIQQRTGQLENTARLRSSRRDVARAKTALNALRNQA